LLRAQARVQTVCRVRYRSFLESLSLSAATINLHLSAVRRLADEAADGGCLSPELAIGIRRVRGVKRLGRRIGNWLNSDQAQDLLDAISLGTLPGKRDAAMIGLLFRDFVRERLLQVTDHYEGMSEFNRQEIPAWNFRGLRAGHQLSSPDHVA